MGNVEIKNCDDKLIRKTSNLSNGHSKTSAKLPKKRKGNKYQKRNGNKYQEIRPDKGGYKIINI